jgi:hypothetical protein
MNSYQNVSRIMVFDVETTGLIQKQPKKSQENIATSLDNQPYILTTKFCYL